MVGALEGARLDLRDGRDSLVGVVGLKVVVEQTYRGEEIAVRRLRS